MAVVLELPRGRPALKDAGHYPGLTPEEKAIDLDPEPPVPPELEPPSALWVAPSTIPAGSRVVGFIAALPEPLAPPPMEPEGLFDVPGLLERLWLARALESTHRERAPSVAPTAPAPGTVRTSVPSPDRSAAVSMAPPPETPIAPPLVEGMRPRPGIPVSGPAPDPTAPAAPVGRPSCWVCPYCYLANDPSATTCRGCRSSSLHL